MSMPCFHINVLETIIRYVLNVTVKILQFSLRWYSLNSEHQKASSEYRIGCIWYSFITKLLFLLHLLSNPLSSYRNESIVKH